MRYISLDRPSVLPPDFLRATPSTNVDCLSDIQERTGKGRLHTTDDDIVLLVRNPTPPPIRPNKHNSAGRAACLLKDEPVRTCAPLLMRLWIMLACHSTASCHLSTTRMLRVLERFYWWIGMNVCTRWWLRHWLKTHATTEVALFV